MKTTLKVIAYFVCTLFICWVLVSWVDVILDNCEPNPKHYDWNFFVVMTSAAESDPEAGCGNPITAHTRIDCGVIVEKDGDLLTIQTEDGNLWEVEVGYGENFSEWDYLCVFFDNRGTECIEDDEIVKIFVEKW